MEHRKPSKVTQKDRYGNQVTYEYAPDTKPLDPTALAIHAMDQNMEVPEITMIDQAPPMDHPGEPRGSDTVPAWLTPGEFVVNAEAMRMPGAKQAVESLNNQGRAMQQMQGGSIPSGYMLGGNVEGNTGPHYVDNGGQVPFIAGPRMNEPQYQDAGGSVFDNPAAMARFQQEIAKEQQWLQGLGLTGTPYSSETERLQDQVQDLQNQLSQYKDDGGWITDSLLDKLAEVESGWDNDAVSPVGAIGTYQWLPKSAAQAGYGVKAFDPKDPKAARAATAKYLKNMQKHHGFTPEETLRAYNWGPGNVLNYNKGKRKDIPAEALNYPRKILGADNPLFQGVTPNETNSVPLPTARPSREIATPTPKPASVNADASWWDKTKEALGFEGGGHVRNPFPPGTYAHQQFEANRPGQVEYTPPPIDLNVSPDAGSTSKTPGYGITDGLIDLLTAGALGFDSGGSVPGFEGQDPNKMSPIRKAAYDKALAKMQNNNVPVATQETINRNNPEVPVIGNVPELESGDVNTIEDGDDSPWYSGLLGHKSKDALNIPLNEDDKKLKEKAEKESFALSGPGSAAHKNVGLDDVPQVGSEQAEFEAQKKANLIMNGPQVDEIKSKTDIVKENSTEIAGVNAAENGEVQTGPDKNQPGGNKSDAEVEAKGKEAPKGFVDQAKSALVGAFGDLFDAKELGRMAIMYAGSRALGYSHGGSLQFAAKQYVTRVDAANASHKSYVKDLAKSGKYTTKSVEAYNKSKDLSDLQAAGVARNPTGQFKTFYDSNGKKVRAQQFKEGKSTGWMTSDGRVVTSSFTEDAGQVKGTPEYSKRVQADSKQYESMLSGLRSQFGTTKIEGKPDILATELVPAVAGNKIAKWALDNKVPPEYMGSIVENAYHGAIAHSKSTGEKVRDLTSFLNNQYVISQVGDPLLFTKADGEAVSGPAVSKLMSQVRSTASGLGKKITTAQALQGYRAAWTKLDKREQDLWNGKADEDEETGFMKWIQNDITKTKLGG